MQKKDTRTMFMTSVWAATPLFVYILLSLVSSFVVVIGWMMNNNILSFITGDFTQLESVIQEKLADDYAAITYASSIVEYLLMIPVFAFMMYRDKKKLLLTGKIRPAAKIPAKWYLLIIAAGAAVCIAGSNLITLSGLAEESESYQATADLLYSAPFPIQLVVLGIMAPLMEELLFRGLIYKRFRVMNQPIMAMLWSAMVFALLHGNLVQGIYAFVVGMILCFVYYRYGTILAPVLFHMTANIVSVTADAYVGKYPGLGSFFGVTFICFALIILCLYLEELYVRPLSVDIVIGSGDHNNGSGSDSDRR